MARDPEYARRRQHAETFSVTVRARQRRMTLYAELIPYLDEKGYPDGGERLLEVRTDRGGPLLVRTNLVGDTADAVSFVARSAYFATDPAHD